VNKTDFKVDATTAIKTNMKQTILNHKIKTKISYTEKKTENLSLNKLIYKTGYKKNKGNSQFKKNEKIILHSPSEKSSLTDIHFRRNLFSPAANASKNASKVLSPCASLKPFPVFNNEFYNEAINNVLWEGEAQKLKAEKSLSRNNTERKYLRNNMFIFNKVL